MARHNPQRGFTLIELLIAITLMAIMAGMSWRGLDGLMRTRNATQTHVDQIAVVQTVLAQWHADLDAMQPVPTLNDAGVSWDGQTLRLTRRASTWRTDGSDAGLWVVAWTRRDTPQAGNNQGVWVRWQSPALQSRASLQQAWTQAERWGKNPSSEDQALETTLLPLNLWQISYFRGNAWSNPLSSGDVASGSISTGGRVPTSGGAPPNGGVLPNSNATPATPDAIRLLLELPAQTGLRGRLTLDWVRPNFSNTKT
ncbi:Prokaryotic N-terminal methylation site [Burkholderiaceae bacterium]